MDKIDIDKLKTYIKEQKEQLNMFGYITTLENDLKRTEKLINAYEELQKDNKSWKKYCNELDEEIIEKNNKIFDLENILIKKDKIINELIKYIENNNYVDSEECQFQYDFKINKCIVNGDCKDCIKKYFENLIN